MKHNPGKRLSYLCCILLLLSVLQAENFSYDFHTSTLTPYKKESILLSVDINQTNEEIVLFFNFNVKPSKDYTVEQIDSVQDHTLHHTYIHYTYLLRPLKSGTVNVGFDLLERVTDENKVAYSFSGDRDDFKKLETKDRKVAVPPIHLKVKTLPKGTQLVGDFNLSYEVKRHHTKSYAPLPLKVVLEGKGYPPVLETLFPENEHFTLFSQNPLLQKSTDKKSITYKATYALALSAEKSFILPALTLKAFDPKKERSYLLTLPEQSFQVDKEDPHILLDNSDTPAPFTVDFSWLKTLFGCLIVFLAGYMTALMLKWNKKKKHTTPNSIAREKIEACTEPKALLQMLIATNSREYVSEIEALENGLYREGTIEMKKIKKSALEKTA